MTIIKWNPDPRWPPEVIEMAEDIANGVDSRFALGDWLEDHNMPELARVVRTEPLGMVGRGRTRGVVTGFILNDGYIPGRGWETLYGFREALRYLATQW